MLAGAFIFVPANMLRTNIHPSSRYVSGLMAEHERIAAGGHPEVHGTMGAGDDHLRPRVNRGWRRTAICAPGRGCSAGPSLETQDRNHWLARQALGAARAVAGDPQYLPVEPDRGAGRRGGRQRLGPARSASCATGPWSRVAGTAAEGHRDRLLHGRAEPLKHRPVEIPEGAPQVRALISKNPSWTRSSCSALNSAVAGSDAQALDDRIADRVAALVAAAPPLSAGQRIDAEIGLAVKPPGCLL